MIELIVTIAILGLIVWAIVTFIPMPVGFKNVIYVVAIVCLVVFLLRAFGLWHGGDIPVPQLR